MPKAITMWDFSWLLRRTGQQREYENVAGILDELVERGYDCVRIDAFPHLIAADINGDTSESFLVHPQPDHFMWGPHGDKVPVTAPGDSLAQFLNLCRDRNVTVALSSWFNDDDEHRRLMITTPNDLGRVWRETLQFLENRGLLDVIEYVDLCNEFPLADWLPAAYEHIFGQPEEAAANVPGQAVTGGWTWDETQRRAISQYFLPAGELRARWPHLRFTVSLAPISESVHDLDFTSLDLIETHVWLSSNVTDFAALTNFALDDFGFPGAWQKQVDSLDEVYWPDPDRWHRLLGAEMTRWAETARRAGRPLWTTEGWSHILLDDFTSPEGRSAWDYVKTVAEYAIPKALALGWEGICTSNFSEPHFSRLWNDVDWHRRMTSAIKGTST
ncbi:hypothetical protein GCM10025867_02120 [Frondihabitans sucicola]|uniref:Cellulase n=1 Tax=Frondihabitans sucicola TaxID=1268041 RepID=A0ABN6XWC9_9MICO|nr:cellulase-like family protein [Frondihabitans sucicola]BDZ47971.1 hypothetical protein GCM10025867_02120 [Frondihabitans sucicola]